MTEIPLKPTINTVEGWQTFLKKWSEEWLTTQERFSLVVQRNKWLGSNPATEKQITALEKNIGYRLPPSFRSFLLTSNGWRRTSSFILRIRPVTKIEWLKAYDPELIDIWNEFQEECLGEYDGLSRQEYFSYSGKSREAFNKEHFKTALLISDHVPGDSAMYLLNPMVVTKDGEWEAWFFANWLPGVRRYPSFSHLLLDEYKSFQLTELKIKDDKYVVGPFKGVYAPDRPRRQAKRISSGDPITQRLTVEELVEQLRNPSAKIRKNAANILMRCEFKPHNPDDERPLLIEPLSRILHSDLEKDVRCAAACIMGTYGNENAIEPLVTALKDPEIAGSAIAGLFYLNMYHKSLHIVDGLCDYLSISRDCVSTTSAINILQGYREPRLASIALRILDDDNNNGDLYWTAALALVLVSKQAADELMTRLKHKNPKIREVSAGALRETKDRRAIPLLKEMLNDEDLNVRQQAKTSLRFIKDQLSILDFYYKPNPK